MVRAYKYFLAAIALRTLVALRVLLSEVILRYHT